MSVVIREALPNALSLYNFQFKFHWISNPGYLYESTCSNGLCPRLNISHFFVFLPCKTIFDLELLNVYLHFSPYSVITFKYSVTFFAFFVIITMSSVYSRQFIIAFPHLIPVPALFMIVTSSLKNIANWIGESTPPCFTPSVMLNGSDRFPSRLILLNVFL